MSADSLLQPPHIPSTPTSYWRTWKNLLLCWTRVEVASNVILRQGSRSLFFLLSEILVTCIGVKPNGYGHKLSVALRLPAKTNGVCLCCYLISCSKQKQITHWYFFHGFTHAFSLTFLSLFLS